MVTRGPVKLISWSRRGAFFNESQVLVLLGVEFISSTCFEDLHVETVGGLPYQSSIGGSVVHGRPHEGKRGGGLEGGRK